MFRLGIQCKTYRNTATWDTPTWGEVSILNDFMVDPQWDRAEALTRESRVKRGVSTMVGMQFTGKILVRRSDAHYLAFLAAFQAQTPLDLLILDGKNNVAGSEGVRLLFDVIKFTDDQGPSNLRYRDFTIDPALSVNVPQLAIVNESNTLVFTPFAEIED